MKHIKERNISLQVLRGISCIFVFIIHYFEEIRRFNTNLKTNALSQFAYYADFGKIGVVSFFCLSGYLIVTSINSSSDKKIIKFLTKRFFRLYPAYWFSLCLLLVIFPGHFKGLHNFLTNLTMLQYTFETPYLNRVFWSLETEMYFYFLSTTFFIWNWHRVELFWKIHFVVFLLILFFFINYGTLYKINFYGRLIFNVSLMLLASQYRELRGKGPRKSILKKAFGINCILVMYPICNALFSFMSEGNQKAFTLFISYFSGIFFFVFALKFPLKKNFLSKIFCKLGDVSYSFYLTHIPILYLVFNSLPSFLIQATGYSSYLTMIISYILCNLFALLMHEAIEKPCLKLSYFINGLPSVLASLKKRKITV